MYSKDGHYPSKNAHIFSRILVIRSNMGADEVDARRPHVFGVNSTVWLYFKQDQVYQKFLKK